MPKIPHHPDAMHFHEVAAHLLALNPAERRSRFGRPLDDAEVIDRVERMMVRPEDVFVITDPGLDVIGVAHLEFKTGFALLGLSVSRAARGQGVGTLLLERAWREASMRGASAVFVHGLGDNAVLRRMALNIGMRVAFATSDRSVRIELPVSDERSIRVRRMERTVTLADQRLLATWHRSRTASASTTGSYQKSMAPDQVQPC